MELKTVKVGMLETNVYILINGSEALVIDPGAEVEKILPLVDNLKIVGIIVTHHHFDHVGALEPLTKISKTKLYDIHNMKEGKNKIGSFFFEVIYTPGHKEDSISIYFEKEKLLFAGDFIFKGSIGRTDLLGGNFQDMKKSIEKMLEYPNDLKVFPGHGEPTTLGSEKVNLEKYLKYF